MKKTLRSLKDVREMVTAMTMTCFRFLTQLLYGEARVPASLLFEKRFVK